jgi:hypothetical protein
VNKNEYQTKSILHYIMKLSNSSILKLCTNVSYIAIQMDIDKLGTTQLLANNIKNVSFVENRKK